MNAKTIKAAIFDFGGVISKTMFETHRESERALGLEAGALTWRGPFDPETDELWRRMQADEISERDYWLARAVEVGKLLGEEWSSMQELVRRARGQDPESVIRPEALATFARLADKGIALVILSNELELFYGGDFRTDLGFLSKFAHIFDASFSDILKPDPRAYQQCLDALGCDAGQCLFIDDQERNVLGAEKMGFNTVHFDVRSPKNSYNEALTIAGLGSLA